MPINFSIIVPHHNIPLLLKRCLTSIPCRNDLEIIVVDDASDEEYKPILKSVCYNDIHTNVKLIELNKNGGGGKARNEGLKHAKGKFVLFADADDFYNYCINDILDEYKNTDADIVFFKGNCVDNETYISGERLNYLNDKIDAFLSSPDEKDFELRYNFQVPVCKLIRRSLIAQNNILFDETSIRNDVTFSYTLGYHAGRIIADNRALYCATTRDGSVSTFRSSDKILTTIDVLGRAVQFFRTHNLDSKGYEIVLSHNLYILLRRKDYDSFNQGFLLLQNQGFEKNDIERFFSKRMAETALSSCVWCIIFSPMCKIRLYSFKYLPIAIFSKK